MPPSDDSQNQRNHLGKKEEAQCKPKRLIFGVSSRLGSKTDQDEEEDGDGGEIAQDPNAEEDE